MKRSLTALFLLMCLPLLYAQKSRYGQEPPYAKPGAVYPPKVHISGIRISQDCSSGTCYEGLATDAVLNQQKIELSGGFVYVPKFFRDNLVLGDYPARLLKIAHKGAKVPFYDEYELLLPDRHVWQCYVTGIFE